MIKTTIAPQPLRTAIRLGLAVLVGGLASQASALSFQPSDELSVDWDTTLSYGLAWRTEGRDRRLTANADGNDGDNAFDRGSLINNRVGFISEADFKWREDYGLFVRAAGFYDNVYDQGNDNASGTSNCFAGGQCSRPDRFSQETIDQHREDLRLLDSYFYGSWDIGGHNLNLRLGDQVVSWGESLFYQGISSAQSPVDATKTTTPGVEVKEILLPVGQLFGQLSLTDNLGLQAYYQYEWEKTELFGVGSYFSTTDLIDEGGFNDSTGFLRRLKDDKPSDSGQYGVALTYTAESLNNTEFGLYYSRYHDKTPTLDFLSDFGSYRVRYFDDIDQYGASFATVLGETSLAGEVSYRDGQPVLVDTATTFNGFGFPIDIPLPPHAVRAKTLQAQMSMIHVLGPTAWADNTTLVGEVIYNNVLSHDKAESFSVFIPGIGPLDSPRSDTLFKDRDAWGYTVQATFDYNNVFSGWDMSVPITYSTAAQRDSSLLGSINSGEGDDRMSVGSTWRYLGNFTVEASYNVFLGNAKNSPLADRDNLALNFKYRF
ncbi:uncharacterized protein DUF1302 [Pseudomonas sp. SJZ079]|uniref:DUF1302 domain-containing protein n=1 Tax=Pseudomonas sp. SJZ079 TaxID=2572887 RepID=UPI00119A16BA|nr:DUF1302 domain-containing protein [Pseudomonas sp. SJZ079]TWC38568.1 uncharacterized protein DUF1302 [Pseudomonas sp. SJZ079]